MTHALWTEYLLRFAHVVAGISWIGSSFYFIWLDSAFRNNEVFMVHGGFYYRVEKKKIAPGELPSTLHWFKWEATLTWLTGFILFFFLYYLKGASLLIGAQSLSQLQAISLSLSLIVGSWFLYDWIWWPGRKNSIFTITASFLLFGGLVYFSTEHFSPRGAFLLMGAIMGNMMLLNVWIRILPGQSKMLRAAQGGEVPDSSIGLKSKTRSVHNTYFIFPVLLIMLSHHYPPLYAHPMRALVLVILCVSGALIRHTMVTTQPKQRLLVIPAAIGLILLFWMTAPTSQPDSVASKVEFSRVEELFSKHCLSCHSSQPTDTVYHEPPRGVILETEEQIKNAADKIHLHVWLAKTMPLGNKTQMQDGDRLEIVNWLKQEKLVH